MQGYIFVGIYFLSILAFGLSFLSFCEFRRQYDFCGRLLLFALSFILGAGVVAFLMFWFLLLGVEFSRQTIVLLAALSLVAVRFSKAHRLLALRASSEFAEERLSFVDWSVMGFSLLAVMLGVFLVSVNALLTPLWDVDSFALWGFKAKVLYLSSLDKTAYFFREDLGFSHLEYPLLMPLLSAGIYACQDAVCESLGKIICIPVFVSIVCFLLSLASFQNKSLGFLIAALYSSMPALLHWAGAGTAEIWLLAFYFMLLYFSMEFMRGGATRDLEVAFAAALFMSFTKNEGLPIGIITLSILMIYSVSHSGMKNFRLFLICGIFSLFVFIPWLVWSFDIPRIHENYPAQIKNIFSVKHLERIPKILSVFVAQFLDIRRWGLFWLLVIPAAFLGRKQIEIKFLIGVLLLNLSLYLFVLIISPWQPQYLAASALERLFLHLSAPAMMILIKFLSANFSLSECIETKDLN